MQQQQARNNNNNTNKNLAYCASSLWKSTGSIISVAARGGSQLFSPFLRFFRNAKYDVTGKTQELNPTTDTFFGGARKGG